MAIFSWLFGKKDEAKQETIVKPVVSDNSIRFRPELVEKLINEHREIVIIYREMKDLFDTKDYGRIGTKVNEFKRKLQSHVIVENVQFYTYLENKLRNDPTNLEFIREVRKEMNGIAHAVVQFSRKYENVGFSDQIVEEFAEDLEEIGDVLTQRVEMEESQLYSLYEQ
jgi:regulator of sigma D